MASRDLADSSQLAELFRHTENAFEQFRDHARARTNGGRDIDSHQILTRHVAGMATRIEAARALHDYAEVLEATGHAESSSIGAMARAWLAETALDLRHAMEVSTESKKFRDHPLLKRETLDAIAPNIAEERYREIGAALLEAGGENNRPIGQGDGEVQALRAATRRFAQTVIAPEAEAIHREDLLVPEHVIREMSDLGYFGMSVPEEYGGVGMSNLMMVVATEELSAVSLPAAGSLITRPEILAKALLKGGTEEQKTTWLPKVASGEVMVAVSVTEPNVGSDVAGLMCRADAVERDGVDGYSINGAKAWCTFAGRADILALLARTEPDASLGHKGLSLFIVEKERAPGKTIDITQPGGGRLTGKADATIGYRGMHSFTLQFEDFFVPAENLVGGAAGRGKGFYLQMDGFAAGRLQTGGRATGLAQGSLEAAIRYARERPQFGRPIAEYQNTQFEIGRMAVELEASRQVTCAAARAMDEDGPRATLLAAMAKLLASRAAVTISQRAQLVHGGWGYAEEYAISRYVCDALVLPIFEGVEPVLELKVIGRALLSG